MLKWGYVLIYAYLTAEVGIFRILIGCLFYHMHFKNFI